jgi:trk system potassium uptake protein TrkA
LDYIEFSNDYSIIETRASGDMLGKSLRQLDIRAKYKCNVIALRKGDQMIIPPHVDEPLNEMDVLVLLGKNEDLQKFEVEFSE